MVWVELPVLGIGGRANLCKGLKVPLGLIPLMPVMVILLLNINKEFILKKTLKNYVHFVIIYECPYKIFIYWLIFQI